MNNRNERELLVETGRELLEKNIVARTWGNTSCRVDDEHCLITPERSGLHADYRRRYRFAGSEERRVGRQTKAFWRTRCSYCSVQTVPWCEFCDPYSPELRDGYWSDRDRLIADHRRRKETAGRSWHCSLWPSRHEKTDRRSRSRFAAGDPDGPHGASWRAGLRT